MTRSTRRGDQAIEIHSASIPFEWEFLVGSPHCLDRILLLKADFLVIAENTRSCFSIEIGHGFGAKFLLLKMAASGSWFDRKSSLRSYSSSCQRLQLNDTNEIIIYIIFKLITQIYTWKSSSEIICIPH